MISFALKNVEGIQVFPFPFLSYLFTTADDTRADQCESFDWD
jgi:hypothetical protein